ncbi:unnamed protein product, partial [marine sediment metagenome]
MSKVTGFQVDSREKSNKGVNTIQYDIIDINSLGGAKLHENLNITEDRLKTKLKNLLPEAAINNNKIRLVQARPPHHQNNSHTKEDGTKNSGNLCSHYADFYDQQITARVNAIDHTSFDEVGHFSEANVLDTISGNVWQVVGEEQLLGPPDRPGFIAQKKTFIEHSMIYNTQKDRYESQWAFDRFKTRQRG